MDRLHATRRASFVPIQFEPCTRQVVFPKVQKHAPSRRTKKQARDHLPPSLPYIEPELVSLCRRSEWRAVIDRCESHPHEAAPQPLLRERNRLQIQQAYGNLQEAHVARETALGVACASWDLSTNDATMAVLALLHVAPEQVACSQMTKGSTPLREALRNSTCTPRILHALLTAVGKLAFDRLPNPLELKDRDGMYPLDHLLLNLQLGVNKQSIEVLQIYMEWLNSSAPFWEDVSPLIRLLSSGTSLDVHHPRLTKEHRESEGRLQRVERAVEIILKLRPSLLFCKSKTTGCNVLHVALRNYGNCKSIVEAIIRADKSNELVSMKNNFFDLPLHVASSVGVPLDILELILKKTTVSHSILKAHIFQPLPLAWCPNINGYTPVDLEWVRHIESGKGLYAARSFYPLETSGIRHHCRKQNEYYCELLGEAVHNVLSKGDTHGLQMTTSAKTDAEFGLLIDRILLLCCYAAFGSSEYSTPMHAVALLSFPSHSCWLPAPLLELFVLQCQKCCHDSLGRLPLHYALDCCQPLADSKESGGLKAWATFVKGILNADCRSLSKPDGTGLYPIHCLLRCDESRKIVISEEFDEAFMDILEEVVEKFPESVDICDPVSGLLPFMTAACMPGLPLDAVYYLLLRSPSHCVPIPAA